jgi:L-lactate dehydrogenase complex protein LldF
MPSDEQVATVRAGGARPIPDAAEVPAPEPEPATPDRRSAALLGRERIVPTRPDWAAAAIPAHRKPLPIMTREALGQAGAAATHTRLSGKNRVQNGLGWPPEIAALRERGAEIRRETLRDLEGYLAALTEKAEANGVVVHRAATPDDATRIITKIAQDNDVTLVVKSKSMATEEIHLNASLEDKGIEVVETDLGEYIVQVADERPSHIVGPALHKSQAEVGALFEELAGGQIPQEAEALAAFARTRLRSDFHRADMGISGVNFAAADTGTLTLVTNEGNADMVTSQPRIHVAVMPMEKVIPRFRDIAVLVPLLCYAATMQKVSVYQTMLNGPRREGELDGPEQLHLVILDNGRSSIVGSRYEEVLACIRCGNCQIACPVYRTVGGHAYGSVYGGPIGAVLTPLLANTRQGTDLPFLSSLCGACFDACPVKIPLPDMLVDLRADYEAKAARGRPRRWGWRLWAKAWDSPRVYRATMTALRLTAPLLPRAVIRHLPGPGKGWATGRELPTTRTAGAFRSWFAGRRPR